MTINKKIKYLCLALADWSRVSDNSQKYLTNRKFISEMLMNLETAFTMDTSSIKFGKGVTKEIGSDFKNMGVNRLMICTDNRVAKLSTMEVVEASLKEVGLEYEIYSGVSVEPTDVSFLEAIDFAKKGKYADFFAPVLWYS